MRLWIAEKPDQARAIADGLPQPIAERPGFFECGDREIVTWAKGHLYDQADPEEYDPALKAWNLETLPFIPDTSMWKYTVKDSNKRQLECIQSLLKTTSNIVHAADNDREGQRIIDAVLTFADVDPSKVSRLLINALDPKSVRAAIDSLVPNAAYISKGEAARARACDDWTIGINLTRIYTILSRRNGYGRTVSIGRVKTPTLKLVVDRDLAIQSFRSILHYRVVALLNHTIKGEAVLEWRPAPDTPSADEEGRILDPAVAANVVKAVSGTRGHIVSAETVTGSEPPKLPHSITTLTIEANKQLGLTAGQIRMIAQRLYERYKLISYPRTDSQYLPENQHTAARDVLTSIAKNAPGLAGFVQHADPTHMSRAWDAPKIGAHHGIIPTDHSVDMAGLAPEERAVYELVCRRYVAQFYPDSTFATTTIRALIGGYVFGASERELTSPGWRVLFTLAEKLKAQSARKLPAFEADDQLLCTKAEAAPKNTVPPPHYKDGSLMLAMQNIDAMIENKELRKTLLESDGIGTSATRGAIIEELVSFGLLARTAKNELVSTLPGREIVHVVHESICSPELTARWEQDYKRIEDGVFNADTVIENHAREVRHLVTFALANPPKPVLGRHRPTRTKAELTPGAGKPRPAFAKRARVSLRPDPPPPRP